MSPVTPTPDFTAPEPGQLFRHQDGGCYQVVAMAQHTEDLTPLVIYTHLWPFKRETWARPAHEWASRFTRMTQRELDEEMLTIPAEQAQAIAIVNKATRRAAQEREASRD